MSLLLSRLLKTPALVVSFSSLLSNGYVFFNTPSNVFYCYYAEKPHRSFFLNFLFEKGFQNYD
ncbi:predicted protein [Arabidopsis lyrata subsp. lyrata]|uniref:Predicted protein n=1 Tax=Arabidopsis lyrata subsp. lyrata TaxID=81972 RepID=D7LSD3_ARALL|nr:predicted protein [Arabidopsis lyrata subsp. lyrata]